MDVLSEAASDVAQGAKNKEKDEKPRVQPYGKKESRTM